MKQKGTINGYAKAIWSGITTIELAKGIKAAIASDLKGLYHLVPENPIDKYELLKLFKKEFKRNDITIEKYEDFVLDKSLINTRNDFDYDVPDYETMIEEMRKWMEKYRSFYTHYGMFHELMNFLQRYGFTVTKDPNIEKNYKCLSKDHRYGKKGDLEFKSHRYPRGFKIEFFQNIAYDNPNGGEYDFDKIEKMPYLIKLSMFVTLTKIKEFFNTKGITGKDEVNYRLSEDRIKYKFVESWHHPQTDTNFCLSDLDGTTYESYNATDRDNMVIHDGDIKYYRDWGGHLCRGKVYHNINNMWWVIVNKYEWTNIADFDLFDATAEDYQLRRFKKPVLPKDYLDRRKEISNMTDKELLREIKRRKLA
jgi:hypothetical protein